MKNQKSYYITDITKLDEFLIYGVAFKLNTLKEIFNLEEKTIVRRLFKFEYEFEQISEFGNNMWVKRPSPVFDGIKMRDIKCLKCFFGRIVSDEKCECHAPSPSDEGKFPIVKFYDWCGCFTDEETHKQPLRKFLNV